ncbi:hypothetical protein [Chitinophaga pinensis]|uniref:Phage head morphogenesis domain-containing protein n=1 Tax=Chitinophaga pinensis (strain ATCC 43595 / DSM 2588 / LMG 13176 / NBRC 15968 / NCIMB 11800 / UQM 2034) TaxID=485918 RepID=A0A979G671_CHIPD|nr:hypothetical protein [Chitinophaga pinensis]ACU61352.1 hypothetical protein Cpin_3890 [Chitinophaga pinensis DSM 2588]
MTSKELTEASRAWERNHIKLEKRWQKKIKRAMDVNLNNFIDYARKNSITSAVKVIDTLMDAKPISDVLKQLYLSVGMAQAVKIKKAVEADSKKSLFDEFLSTMADSLAQFFLTFAITDFIYKILASQKRRTLIILKQLMEEANGGQPVLPSIPDDLITPEQLISEIEDLDRGHQKEIQILKSLYVAASDRGTGAIARTEVTRALNFASFTAAGNLPIYVDKTWICCLDKRVRRAHKNIPWDHREPHGQTVPLEEAYIVSGERLMYPADPAASASNVIGCRCGQTFAARRDANGRVIRKPTGTSVTVILPNNQPTLPTITI